MFPHAVAVACLAAACGVVVLQIPSELHPFVYRPEPNGHETSLVILIHGKGADAHQCVQSLESLVGGLPQTSVLAITGPYPLAAVLGPDAPGALSPHAATWFPVVDLERTEVLPEPTFGDRGKGLMQQQQFLAIPCNERGHVCVVGIEGEPCLIYYVLAKC